jgi:hypothetical protein
MKFLLICCENVRFGDRLVVEHEDKEAPRENNESFQQMVERRCKELGDDSGAVPYTRLVKEMRTLEIGAWCLDRTMEGEQNKGAVWVRVK